MKPLVEVIDHQTSVAVPVSWCEAWATTLGEVATAVTARHAAVPDSALSALETLDVALVDDRASAEVHDEFMGIAGPTDVITFDHGEIVVGIEVAIRQAEAHGESLWREVFRYLVHGVLHLAGHEDATAAGRATMERAQEILVAEFWPALERRATAARDSSNEETRSGK